MGRKKVENQYGVQVGDIFSENRQNCNYASFYQVVSLHGESKVEVREIDQICVAFDGYYVGIVPVPGSPVLRSSCSAISGYSSRK